MGTSDGKLRANGYPNGERWGAGEKGLKRIHGGPPSQLTPHRTARIPVFTRDGSVNSVRSPTFFPFTGSSRAVNGFFHFTAKLATSPRMRSICRALASPGIGMVSRPVPHTAE